jgi:CheY-like chemotaxis protein
VLERSPIVIIDDDPEDCELIKEVCTSLKVWNELIFFSDSRDVLGYLKRCARQPVLILCDVNMPLMNGLQLRQVMERDCTLKEKSIPFVFLHLLAAGGCE